MGIEPTHYWSAVPSHHVCDVEGPHWPWPRGMNRKWQPPLTFPFLVYTTALVTEKLNSMIVPRTGMVCTRGGVATSLGRRARAPEPRCCSEAGYHVPWTPHARHCITSESTAIDWDRYENRRIVVLISRSLLQVYGV